MDLGKQGVDAGGNGRPRKGGHKPGVSPGDIASASRLLHAVRGVEASDSMTQGPAISKRGRPSPTS